MEKGDTGLIREGREQGLSTDDYTGNSDSIAMQEVFMPRFSFPLPSSLPHFSSLEQSVDKYFFSQILHRAQYASKHIHMQISYIKNAVRYLRDTIRNEAFMPQQVTLS